MGLLDDAIREHLELKRRRGADPTEVEREEQEVLGPVRPHAVDAIDDELEFAHPEEFDDEPLAEDEGGSWANGGAEHTAPAAAFDHEQFAEPLPREPEPFAAPGPEPEPYAAAEPEPEPYAAAEPEPEPYAAAEPEPEPYRTASELEPFAAAEHEPEPYRTASELEPFAAAGHEPEPYASAEPEPYQAAGPEPHPAVGPEPEPYPAGGHLPPPYPLAPHDAEPDPFPGARPAPEPEMYPARTPPDADPATVEYNIEDADEAAGHPPAEGHPHPEVDEDVLEETPEFLQDTPDHDRLWFEQRPPRDFDFDG